MNMNNRQISHRYVITLSEKEWYELEWLAGENGVSIKEEIIEILEDGLDIRRDAKPPDHEPGGDYGRRYQ